MCVLGAVKPLKGRYRDGFFVVRVLACQAKWALIGGVFGPTQLGFSTHPHTHGQRVGMMEGKRVGTDSDLEWRHTCAVTLSLPPGSGLDASHSFCFVFGFFSLSLPLSVVLLWAS